MGAIGLLFGIGAAVVTFIGLAANFSFAPDKEFVPWIISGAAGLFVAKFWKFCLKAILALFVAGPIFQFMQEHDIKQGEETDQFFLALGISAGIVWFWRYLVLAAGAGFILLIVVATQRDTTVEQVWSDFLSGFF